MQKVICPHCGYAHVDPEFFCGITSYHGEDGPRSVTCWECGKDFVVIEVVARYWKVGTTNEAAEEA